MARRLGTADMGVVLEVLGAYAKAWHGRAPEEVRTFMDQKRTEGARTAWARSTYGLPISKRRLHVFSDICRALDNLPGAKFADYCNDYFDLIVYMIEDPGMIQAAVPEKGRAA